MTSRNHSNDAKEADILDRCELTLNGGGGKLGVFQHCDIWKNTSFKSVPFKSFERCTLIFICSLKCMRT